VVFSSKPYDEEFFKKVNLEYGLRLSFVTAPLTEDTVALAAGFDAVCVFVNDEVTAAVIDELYVNGCKMIALRCAGFNNVDLAAARSVDITVARVPAYSPNAIAEHAIALMMTLNRKIHKAYLRTREGNFALTGQLGFDMSGKTAGVIGTGKIGQITARILRAFGMRVLAHDLYQVEDLKALGIEYMPLDDVLSNSDVITLHCPLLPSTKHLINKDTIAQMKKGVMLINTSRGGLMDIKAVVRALKTGQIGYLGMDVYDREAGIFFEDLSNTIIEDDVLTRLMTFPNVIITGHQAFFTEEAMTQIATVTLSNISKFFAGTLTENIVTEVPKPSAD